MEPCESMFVHTTAPSIDQVPLEPGSLVELHSLKSAEHLNGQAGRIYKFDESSGRFVVTLLDTQKSMKVKPINLEHLPLKPPDVRAKANNFVSFEVGGTRPSASDIEKALAMDPSCTYAHLLKGANLMRAQQYKASLPHYQTGVALAYAAPADVWEEVAIKFRMQLGNIYGEMEKWASEEEQMHKVLAMAPHYMQAHYALGQALYNQDRYAEALSECEAALELGPNDPRDKWSIQKPMIYNASIQMKYGILETLSSNEERALVGSEEAPSPAQVAEALQRVQTLSKFYDDHSSKLPNPVLLPTALAREATYLNYQAVVFKDAQAASKVQGALNRAMNCLNIPPKTRGYVLHHKAKILVLQADFTDSPDEARNIYQQALDVVKESNNVFPDYANEVVSKQIQAKLKVNSNPQLKGVSGKNPMGGMYAVTRRTPGEPVAMNLDSLDS